MVFHIDVGLEVVREELILVTELYERNIRSKAELGLISRYVMPNKDDFVKTISDYYKKSFNTAKRHITQPIID